MTIPHYTAHDPLASGTLPARNGDCHDLASAAGLGQTQPFPAGLEETRLAKSARGR
ncbi:MAG: hypothetical protein OXN97_23945 [Bryobacterales bacterium]|nr:hypothetical protein [Bryobacterales bacterium]